MVGSVLVKASPVAQSEPCSGVISASFNDSLPRRPIAPDSRQQRRQRLLPHNLGRHDRPCMPSRKLAKAKFFADILLGDCHVCVPPVVWVARSSLSRTSVLSKIATNDSSLLKTLGRWLFLFWYFQPASTDMQDELHSPIGYEPRVSRVQVCGFLALSCLYSSYLEQR